MQPSSNPAFVCCLIVQAFVLMITPSSSLASDPADPYALTFEVSQQFDYLMAAHGFGGFGFAAADVDNDGDVDLYLPTAEGTSDLFLRNVDGQLIDATDSFLYSSEDPAMLEERSGTALWVDYDGDRFLDLLVLADCSDTGVPCAGTPHARLYRQLANGTFIDVAEDVGLDDILGADTLSGRLGGLSAGDLNEDGLPDFFLGIFSGAAGTLDSGLAHLFLSGTEVDPATSETSLQYTHNSELIGNPRVGTWICPDSPPCATTCEPELQGNHWSTVFHDFDANGRLDLLSAIDAQPITLWLSPDPGEDLVALGFTNAADAAGVIHSAEDPDRTCEPPGSGSFIAGTDLGIGISDYNNDGLFDFYFTNSNNQGERTLDAFFQATPATSTADTLIYDDVIQSAGIAPEGTLASWGWGVTFLDANLDGFEDLAFTNGVSFPGGSNEGDASRFFLNTSYWPLSRGARFRRPFRADPASTIPTPARASGLRRRSQRYPGPGADLRSRHPDPGG